MIFYDTKGTDQALYSNIQEFVNVYFFMLMFALNDKKTWETLKTIADSVKNFKILYKNKYSNLLVVGNKSDVKARVVPKEEILDFCKLNNMDYYEVSVKNATNISKLINERIGIYEEIMI